MALIFDRRLEGEPGVHVILIGVGTYPFANGAGLLREDAPASGFSDLESPLHSAEAFADWLQSDLNVAETPLSSIRVLASSATRVSSLATTPPTIGNIISEVRHWAEDVGSHEDNLAIFYFCGHGIRIGETQFLLAQDFGEDVAAPFENCVEPDLLADAMRQHKARRQIYFIDACSTEVPFRKRFEHARGRTIVQGVENQNLARSEQCLLRASKLGTRAFGSPTGPTYFMDALLRAMKGGGAMLAPSRDWAIHTDMLKMALDRLLQLHPDSYGQEVSFGLGALSSNVAFHVLPGRPLVPVSVTCDPPYFETSSALHVNDAAHCLAGQWPVSFELERGSHNFAAVSGGMKHGEVLAEPIAPPFVEVAIRCEEHP